jgi:hypothetical protein
VQYAILAKMTVLTKEYTIRKRQIHYGCGENDKIYMYRPLPYFIDIAFARFDKVRYSNVGSIRLLVVVLLSLEAVYV